MSPRLARVIAYILMFASFPCFGFAMAFSDVMGGLVSMVLLVVGALLFTASVIWALRKVRCPHCNALLPLKLYDIRVCPYCKKSTD